MMWIIYIIIFHTNLIAFNSDFTAKIESELVNLIDGNFLSLSKNNIFYVEKQFKTEKMRQKRERR